MAIERPAAVAGQFYPGDSRTLMDWIRGETGVFVGKKRRVKGVILPHAGYVYSGSCALRALERIHVPRRVIIVGLNHRYHHERLVLDGHDIWKTPLGAVKLDQVLADRLLADQALFMLDSRLGLQEHSLEVMLPLLQYFQDDLRILPILVGCGDPVVLRAAAVRLAHLIKEDPDILLLASTDMSHFISAQAAARADSTAIERICALDADGLMERVLTERISMCGVFSTALVLETVRLLGGCGGEVVCYTHSGELTGDHSSVVAYLSAILD